MDNKETSLDYFRKLGDNIAAIRKEAGFTQDQLAGILGIRQSALANYEAGTRKVSLLMLSKIAKALNLPIEEFLPEEGKKRGPVSKIDRDLAKVKLLPENLQQMVIDNIQSIIRNNQAKV